MKYKILLFDADNTIFDFEKAEELAFFNSFKQENLTSTAQMFQTYKKINSKLWEDFEKGLTTKDSLTIERFHELSLVYNLNLNPSDFNQKYLSNLACGSFIIDGADDLLEKLSKDYKMYIITNGVATSQHKRICNSSVNYYFKDIIVSEEAMANKPDKEFFDYTFKKIGIKNKSDVLVIGDSLTADIKGANNYNLDSCWYNPKNICNTTDIKPTYTVKNFDEIANLLK